MTEVTELRCPSCDASLAADDRFCEQCGARLLDEEPPAAHPDRIELDLVVAAAVSDRGRVHRRNEDAFHLVVRAHDEVAVVVCDGISSASAGDAAARQAAKAAGEALLGASAGRADDGGIAVLTAVEAAQTAVEAVPWTTRTGRDMPACTLVSALCRSGEITIGSVGDSRAYWIESGGAQQLTVDDSWAEEQVADGVLTLERALADPRSHAVTHWIGADAPTRPPRVTAFRPQARGHLLLCTDGLWNYLAGADEVVELIGALPVGASPAAIARSLVELSLVRGGRDNITIAVVDIDPRRGA